ncbi:hypothetical protein SPRG_11472 [Saprolegnia parasitica CBS 223.65]|uniref:Uncharacterized protein n=1 Tax=Saprolegnia parasitica (strain CBS 223.65) TaxID=695850 RepID=A0A067C2L0_SAPPC|nr:hypothetical protein SPRG_11472 [Saprolegnia parasitica CBS 223.65]KDO23380.1 hypothetical protein SPRG_11472 [Saprolegnia parasitica CBS 223.65]|eukprot:XP_012205870.1 hypothetical protein SPRG_11472 [Saprolegnia parasitica CBS 223.65]
MADFAAAGLRLTQTLFAAIGLVAHATSFPSGHAGHGVAIQLGGPTWDACLLVLCVALIYGLWRAIPEVRRVRQLRSTSVYDTTRTDLNHSTMLEALTVTPTKRRELLTDAAFFLVAFSLGVGASLASYNSDCTEYASAGLASCGLLRLEIAAVYLVGLLSLGAVGLWLHGIDPEERFVYIKFVLWPPRASGDHDDAGHVSATDHDDVKYSESAVRYTGAGVPDSARGHKPTFRAIDV